MSVEVICGDALVELPRLVERGVRVSLINADIPYFKVKDDEWDRQWKNEKDYLAWVDALCRELKQVLLPNGSLYLYASPQMARKVGNVVAEHFNVLTDIRWRKPAFSTKAEMFRKEDLRAYFPASETIFFCEQCGSDEHASGEAGYTAAETALKRELYGNPLRLAMAQTNTSTYELTEAVGAYGRVNHGGAASNWLNGFNVPTPEQYARIWTYLRDKGATPPVADYDGARGEYERLRAMHESLRSEFERLRRPFTVSPDVPYTDVWDFPTVSDYAGKHPCEKPYAMMEHIVRASSREGDTVLDCCAGSGVFGEAAAANNRNVIMIERDEFWAHKAERRAKRATRESNVITLTARDSKPLPLFEASR